MIQQRQEIHLPDFLSEVSQKDFTPKEAMQMAAKASAIAVSRQGAAPSIPELNEVYDFGR